MFFFFFFFLTDLCFHVQIDYILYKVTYGMYTHIYQATSLNSAAHFNEIS